MSDPDNELLVSVASLWEATIKQAMGRLDFPDDLDGLMAEQGWVLLPIRLAHLSTLRALPPLHKDPFDRMLAAQALTEGVPVVTGDPRIGAYGMQTVWG